MRRTALTSAAPLRSTRNHCATIAIPMAAAHASSIRTSAASKFATIDPASSVPCCPSRFTDNTVGSTGSVSRTVRKIIGAAIATNSTPPNHVESASQ